MAAASFLSQEKMEEKGFFAASTRWRLSKNQERVFRDRAAGEA